MKPATPFKIVCLFLLGFSTCMVKAQDAEKNPVFGLGVSFRPFSLATLLSESENVPPARLNFTINPTRTFHLELDAGYLSRKEKESGDKYTAALIGIGLMGGKYASNLRVMGGVRFDYTASTDAFDYDNNSRIKLKGSRISFGPAVQGEYFFSGHFSAAADLSLRYVSNSQDQFNGGSISSIEKAKTNSFTTETALYFRFYF